MTKFIPGEVVRKFISKTGRTVELCLPDWTALRQLHEHINELSAENTFITFSGQKISLEEEASYLGSVLMKMEFHDAVYVYAFVEEKLAGVCEVSRNTQNKERSAHVGVFGISLRKEYRGDGIGLTLAHATIQHAQSWITGLKQIQLQCFSVNTTALTMYRKLGFVECGRLPKMLKHNDEYIDEVLMMLEFPAA